MPDPIWTNQYNITQTPEANGFSRVIHAPDPTVTLVTGGTPANRRIEVNTDGGGDIVFLLSTVPTFDSSLGMTAEAVINVSGSGDVGFEVTFLTLVVGVNIFTNKVTLERVGNTPLEAATGSNNSDIAWRTTYDGINVRVYRAGTLVLGPSPSVPLTKDFQRFLFWMEGGGTGIVKVLRWYIGGAVVPG